MENQTVIELTNVYLQSDRGEDVFRDLNLTLTAGRTAVVCGAAAAGKSTLVELLIGERFADSGSVEVFGRLLRKRRRKDIRRVRRMIGGVGGIFGLMPAFTVTENILFPLILGGEPKKVRRERLFSVLSEFSLLKQAKQYPDTLTRVEKTMVQFARASVANQPLLLIDEPAAGLDRKTYERIVEYLTKVSISGRSMLIVSSEPPSHDLPNADFYEISNGGLV